MTKRNIYRTSLALLGLGTLLLVVPPDIGRGLMARSQDQQAPPASQNGQNGQSGQGQQPSASQNGPTSQPGETVLVPKKAAPPTAGAAAPAPDEKKPEKINPKD